MALFKRLENKKATVETYNGRTFGPAGSGKEFYEIPDNRQRVWKDAADVRAAITSGDLVVNDGVSDLSPSAGLEYLDFVGGPKFFVNGVPLSGEAQNINIKGKLAGSSSETRDVELEVNGTLDIEQDGTLVVDDAESVNFTGSRVSVSADPEDPKRANISINGDDGGVAGYLWQMDFAKDSSSSNYWLDNGAKGIASSQTFEIGIWKSKLVGASWSNRQDSVEVDVKIYVSSENDGISPKTKIYEWQIRNSRVCRKTNFSPDVIIEAGDKVGVFISDQGTNPRDPRLKLVWQIIEDDDEEQCRNFSGDFSLSGGGGTTS